MFYKSNREIFHIFILTLRRLGEFEMQCYNFPSPPPSPTSFFLCVKVRVCKQRNICNLLICWILKWSFAYYLIPNIFFVSDSRWKQWWWGTGHPNIMVYLSGIDSCLLRNLIEAIRQGKEASCALKAHR